MKSPLGDRESRRNNSAGEENITMNRKQYIDYYIVGCCRCCCHCRSGGEPWKQGE